MKDRFSGQAQQYAAFRPHYPLALYDFIFQHVGEFDMAWDAGTGNGQATAALATRFKKVFATDLSMKQLDHAIRIPNIEYAQAAEATKLLDHSVDLVTVAQAIHWFDREKFFAEVRRVGKPGVVVALWGYGLLQIDRSIDPLILDFYTRVVGPYWDPERKLIDQEYTTINFPFEEVPSPQFTMNFDWTLAELEGYLTTWSSVQKYWKEKGENPVSGLIRKILPLWGAENRKVTFELFLRLGN